MSRNLGVLHMAGVTSDTVDLKSKMAQSTEAELRQLQSSLRGLKDGVATDLQRNVFKKYAPFPTLSLNPVL